MKKESTSTIKQKGSNKLKKISLKQIGVFVIVILISLSLIPWVISNDLFSGGAEDNKWVRVGNKYTVSNIILGEYSSFVEKNYYYIQQNPYMLMQFLNNTISQHINVLLFANEAERINLSVDKNLLLNLISEIPTFKKEDGSFNADEFRTRVATIFGSEKVFMTNITDNILKDQLLEPIFPLISEPLFVAYLDLLSLSQERTVKYIDINSQISKASLPKPTDDDLLQLRDENKSVFTTLESRNGEYLTLNINNLITKVIVKEAEVRQHYEQTKNSYLTPELRTISQISFETKEQAEKAFKDLKAGKKIDEEFSNIENIDFSSLPEDFARSIFHAKLNEINKPAQSPIGWHVFKVIKISPQGIKPFSEVKNFVKEELLNTKRSDILEEKRSEINNLINQELALKEIATKTGAVYHKFSNLNEENIYNKKISEEIFKQITMLEESTNSGLMEDGNGDLYIIHLDKIIPSILKTVKEVKPDLLLLWKNKKLEEKSNELESSIIAQIVAGKSIASFGYSLKTFKGTMATKSLPFSAETTDAIFTSEKNSPVAGTLKDRNKIVAIVENIKNKDIQYENKGIRNQEVVNFANYVSDSYTQSFFERYATIISKKYKIKINEKAIMNKLAPKNPND